MKMKKILAGAMAAVLAIGMMAGCNNTGNTPGDTAQKTIAVVAKGESHAFWQSVKAGAEAAGAASATTGAAAGAGA